MDIGDVELSRFDLSVLIVQGIVGKPSRLKIPQRATVSVSCEGFTTFFQTQYARRQVNGTIQKIIETVMPDGKSLAYLEIKPTRSGPRFDKGMSGAPVYDQKKNVIGVARILDESTEAKPLGYAIQVSQAVLSLVQEIVPSDIFGRRIDPGSAPATTTTASRISEKRRHSKGPLGREEYGPWTSAFYREPARIQEILPFRCGT